MSRAIKINGEIHFKRRVSNTNRDIVFLIAYVDYKNKNYTITECNQESVFFGKKDIEYDLAKTSLLKDALLFLKKELKIK